MLHENYNNIENYEGEELNFYNSSNSNNDIEEQIKKIKLNAKRVKIMLIGGTGVGKSSLINKIFGSDIAKVGYGVPTSRGIERFEIPERDIIIYDSEGYEVGEDKLEYFNSNIISTIETEGICTVWYCISAPNSRITDYDKEVINKIKSYDIPVHVVLTQGDKSNPKKSNELKDIINIECGVHAFLVTTNYIRIINPNTKKDYGNLELENLLDFTNDNITDEDLRLTFVREQKYSLKTKEKEAIKIVNQHAITNAGIGFTPIPLSDAPLLFASQTTMMGRIIYLYELTEQGDLIKQVINCIGINGLINQSGKMAAKYAMAQVLKLIPSIGSYAGGVINGTVAATFTKTLGYTVSTICYKAKEDEINQTNKLGFFNEKTTEIFLNTFQDYAQKLIKQGE